MTERVTVSSTGAQADGLLNYSSSISADGRFVAFVADASNLVTDDTNGTFDIFVRDRQASTTARVSVDSAGMQGNGESRRPSISADGRFVAFYSEAANLVPGDTNDAHDVFVHDRQTGTTERVSVSSSGAQGNSSSEVPSLSADGRFVAFRSEASNLVAWDTNFAPDVFVHDRQTGTTERVNVSSLGTQTGVESHSDSPYISADGRFVVFDSSGANLVEDDTNGYGDIFVHDRSGGNTNIGTDVDVTVPATLPDGSPTTVTLTFDQVTGSGTTSVTTSPQGPPPPTGFKLTSPPVYYEITTTATFSGSIRVCLGWSEGQIANESNVMLFHQEGGQWVNVTDPSSRNTVDNVVCGTVTSLSPFTLFEVKYSFAGFFQPVANSPVVNSVRAGAAVPLKFSLSGFFGLNIVASGYPRSTEVQCSTGTPLATIEETVTTGTSGLSYDSGTDQYKYVWKTDKTWAETCRQFELRLSDGEVYRVDFSLSR